MCTDFREKGRETEREASMWERNIDRLSPLLTLTKDRTWNLDMCPDGESNLRPPCAQDDAPTNWATPARAMGSF